MSWIHYKMALRLKSPLHVGWRKVGNLQQTRRYVTGKVFWAALTARLTRDLGEDRENGYDEVGRKINENIRIGYFYPALPKEDVKNIESIEDLEEYYPWDSKVFDYLFLNSYASTAVSKIDTSEKGTLHEVEFISPVSRKGVPVYLKGDVWVKDPLPEELKSWYTSLKYLRLGGERGYGWGQVIPHFGPVVIERVKESLVEIDERGHVLAHVDACSTGDKLTGIIEPLVGWERESEWTWKLTENVILAYIPGSVAKCSSTFSVDWYGIWRRVESK